MGEYLSKAALAALLVTAVAGPARAHHSGAMFDTAKEVTLTGTVRQFQWANPHCFIQLVVPGSGGQQVEWTLEMTAPVHLQRLGWKRSTLKQGDRITVTFHPLRNGAQGGNVETVVGPDGKAIGAVL